MSMKFSYWLSNKDKSSKKSAGCMTGIFQLFDRQFLLCPSQINEQHHKKSPSADATISLCNQGVDYTDFCNLESRSSMESSTRTSLSSSSAPCSSLKLRLQKGEPKSSQQSFSSGRSPKNSTKPSSTDSIQSPGFRNSFKESICKDLKTNSMKEKRKEEVKRNKVLKPVDSPRPIDLSNMKELEESLRTLIQLRELPRNFHEVSGSPRFSYDGRISTYIKQANTQKEQRRLSVDSMEDSLRRDFKSKVNSLKKELEKKANSRISEASTLHPDLKSNENHTNIIAKLMGLGPIYSARESCVKGNEPVDKQKKQENKNVKFLQSTSNSPKSPITINPRLKSNTNSRLVAEETKQKMAVEYEEDNVKQKIESAYNVIEKTLQKLEFHHNSKEIRDLRHAIFDSKNSTKCLSPTSKSEKSSIAERALKSPITIRKSESNSAGISSSQSARLEGPSGLRKIKTSDSTDKKKKSLSADGGQTPTGKTSNSLNSSAKVTSGRSGDNSVSPSLQKRKPDQERKSCAVIPSYGLKKNQWQPDNRQQAESVSPSSRIRQKSSKAQANEGKSSLLHQTKGKSATTAASASKHTLHQMIERNVTFVEELEKMVPQLSSPNSVLDASPYQDDLPLSPLSLSSISNEDENLPSALNLKIIHLPQNLPSTFSFKKDSQKQEAHKFIFPGLITDKNDPDNKYVAEVLLSSSLLTEDSQMSAILMQIKLVEPFEAVEKNNTRTLHKQLVYDVVNEILHRKIEAFNSGCQHDHLLKPNMLSLQLLFKELCFEVKYLRSYIDGSVQGKDTVFTKDLIQRSNVWDRFDSEIPVVVLEIERLIFVDLINEILSSLINVVLEPKQRYRRQLFV
ncbi:protein LONGIFOLIA 2-like isoform X2 [Dendrobium catenatum]|uniref:protein LONGIFOLIA 2-like isoform X2 n=1 Tax=Dendrobium catenatum TaxID=906689 RepID=UPI0009F66644|nr:protein LONGIFOLIA 2-like isoform X2 [Dendrobium catenatum]